MNRRMIAHILGQVLLIYAALMLLPMAAGLYYGENIGGFAAASLMTAAAGLLLSRIRVNSTDIFAREGFIAVGLAWVLMGLFGRCPSFSAGLSPSLSTRFLRPCPA